MGMALEACIKLKLVAPFEDPTLRVNLSCPWRLHTIANMSWIESFLAYAFMSLGIVASVVKIACTLHKETKDALASPAPNYDTILSLCVQSAFFGLVFLSHNSYSYIYPYNYLYVVAWQLLVGAVSIVGTGVCFYAAWNSGTWLKNNRRMGPGEMQGLLDSDV
ncbi:hypothetical protein BDQ17DRAFT_1543452 [Cyathus striatus]|nr:hypothetical protein BDQ17DRAFT_1543452 [Cyathus striatus]